MFHVYVALTNPFFLYTDYPKDLNSYMKYCKGVVYAGVTQNPKLHLHKTINMCWNIFDKAEVC